MKPTRKIPATRMTGVWKPKRSVLFKKNDDDTLGRDSFGFEIDPYGVQEENAIVRDIYAREAACEARICMEDARKERARAKRKKK